MLLFLLLLMNARWWTAHVSCLAATMLCFPLPCQTWPTCLRPEACPALLPSLFAGEINKPLPADKDEARYLIFDGDVDAVWVENMNSVMDDNKLLTLPNGERIRLQNHCKLLFEVYDLQYASPATISRCGMVYVDSRNLGYKPFIWTWLNGRAKQSEADILRALFDKYAVPCVDWVLEGVDGDDLVRRPKQTIPVTNLNMITQLCTLLDAIVEDHPRMADPQILEAVFIFCVVWSLGACIVQRPDAPDRDRFDAFVKRLANMSMVDGERVSATQLPAKSLFEYCFDTNEGVWKAWKTYVQPYEPPPDGQFSKILVPTVDVVRWVGGWGTLQGAVVRRPSHSTCTEGTAALTWGDVG